MISLSGITVSAGGRDILVDVSLRLGARDRLGLVGSNGAGKTTLLRVMAGDVHTSRGEMAKAKFVTVGYLPQETAHAAGGTLYSQVESVFRHELEVQQAIEEIHGRMAEVPHESEEFQELLEAYGDLQHRLEDSDAFRMKMKIEKVLLGLGFSVKDFEREAATFSGGWRMRIELAKLLLVNPSLLLLDEPTNHLDLDSLQWLEEYLRSYEGAVILVSHDQRFLDNMTTRTCELRNGRLTEYAGNFSWYLTERAKRKELQQHAHRRQQDFIRQTQQFIDRFRYKATKARQVQSRIKMLEKLDRIEFDDEEGSIHFMFPPAPRGGRIPLQLKGIRKAYGDHRVFEGIDFEIEQGDRIAFVGVNGTGKSTLAKIVAGIEPFDEGERVPGHNLLLSYFAQDQAEELAPDHDVLSIVDEVATGEVRKRLRTLLGCFLFRGDDVFKKVGVLSGGEKSRLALARMLLTPSNLIVMDEPTNHLDMRSKAILQNALAEFEGSFVIVSHDRDFLDPLVTKVAEFGTSGITITLGNVSDYVAAKQQQAERETAAAEQVVPASRPGERDRKRLEAEERQRRYRRARPIQEQIEAVEKGIAQNEDRKAELERLMADQEIYKDGDRARAAHHEYRRLKEELENQYFRWGELTKELERVNGQFHRG